MMSRIVGEWRQRLIRRMEWRHSALAWHSLAICVCKREDLTLSKMVEPAKEKEFLRKKFRVEEVLKKKFKLCDASLFEGK